MKTEKPESGSFLMKKIPAIYPLLLILSLVVVLAFQEIKRPGEKTIQKYSDAVTTNECSSSLLLIRANNSDLISPLLMADISEESHRLQPLKTDIQDLIQSKINMGTLNSASVYLRNMNTGEWISYNGSESYNPGSLIKVPMMISYLKNSEMHPEILSTKLKLDHEVNGMPLQTYNGKSIETGKSYTIKELLGALVSESDNKATFLLNNHADINLFKKVFTDLGLAEPDVRNPDFTIKAADYSRFIRVLYNASYLNKQNSEFAMNLLTHCSFKEGMSKGLPSTVIVGHKFGEMKMNGTEQLHESGIIYTPNGAILLTIMTKGKEVKLLPEVISEITKIVYQSMTKDLTVQ